MTIMSTDFVTYPQGLVEASRARLLSQEEEEQVVIPGEAVLEL